MSIIPKMFHRCKCFLTNNYFLPKYKIHVKYDNNDNKFWSEFGEQLRSLGCDSDSLRAEVMDQLKTEMTRRLNLDKESVKRIQFIEDNYEPKHKDIYHLRDDFLDNDFIDLVERCKSGQTLDQIIKESNIKVISLEKRVYQFNVFTEEFCKKFMEEIDYFNESPMPKARPNTMNNYGILLNELGFDDHFLTPLRQNYLNPMAKTFFPDWFGNSLDSHRAFTIKYGLKEDTDLFTHYDNSEVTLNVCLGKTFEGSAVYFGNFRTELRISRDDVSVTPVTHWPRVGLFHLGQQMHGSLAIEEGERHNLVIWMRSSYIRNKLCPMCDSKPELIPAPGFGDGFTKEKIICFN